MSGMTRCALIQLAAATLVIAGIVASIGLGEGQRKGSPVRMEDRESEQSLSPRLQDFGVKGDGASDDAPALRRLLAASPTVYLPPGTYLLGSPLSLSSGQRLSLSPKARLLASPSFPPQSQMLALNDVIDVVVEGGTIDGNKARNPNGTLLGIAVLGQCQRVRLLNINIRNCPADKDGGQRGDGIYIGCKAGTGKIPNDVLLHGIVSEGNVRQGLSVVAGRGIKISACSFVNTRGRTPGMGIDLEPNSPIDACENIIITGCYLAGNGGGGIQVTKGARTVNITSNTIDCSPDAYPGLKSPEAYAIGLGNNTGEGIVIQGNTIAGSLAGISVGGGKGVVINGNHIARAKMGVHLYGDSHTVTGNVLSQCWMAGIKVQAHRVVITGNIVHDCGDGRCRDSFPVLVNDGWKEGLFSGNLVRESGREDAPTIGVRLPRQREAAWMAALNQIIGYTRPAD